MLVKQAQGRCAIFGSRSTQLKYSGCMHVGSVGCSMKSAMYPLRFHHKSTTVPERRIRSNLGTLPTACWSLSDFTHLHDRDIYPHFLACITVL